MNAVFRERERNPVISTDAIDAKFGPLHSGLQELRTSQSVLHTRMDAIEGRVEKVENKVDALDHKIDAFRTSLLEKLDDFRKELFARLDKQDELIKALDKRVDWVHISVKVVLAILGLCVSVAVIVNALHTVGWV